MHKKLVLCALLLSACGHPLTPEEKARQDEKAIAEVEANQTPPPDEPTPQPIGFDQREKAGIHGSGCSFTPAGSAEDPIAFALVDEGFMQIDGEIVNFAADSGSPETSYGTRVKYDGGRYAMELTFDHGNAVQSGMETTARKAHLVLRDERAKTVFEAEGKADCGA